MSNSYRTLAQLHKRNRPEDSRTVEEIEVHYERLTQRSVFARVMAEMLAKDAQHGAREIQAATDDSLSVGAERECRLTLSARPA